MTPFYYLVGAIFTLIALVPGVTAPAVALAIGLYYLLNTPIGEELNQYPTLWYGFFFVLDAFMMFFMAAFRDPILLGTAVCFGLGMVLTLTTWLEFSLPTRLFATITMMLNAGIVSSAGIYLITR